MRKIVLGGAALVVIVIGLLLIAPSFISVDLYKQQIAEAFKESTGRNMTIDGEIQLSLFPRVQISLEDIRIDNVSGGRADDLAQIAELSLGLQLFPLLSGNVHVDRFALVDPVINLEIDNEQNANWVLTIGDENVSNSSPDAESVPPNVEENSYLPANLSLGDVRLVNGRVTYHGPAGETENIDEINLALSLNDLDSPLSADGSARLRGELISIDFQVDRPRTFLVGGATPTQLKIVSDFGKASFDGSTTTDDQSDKSVRGSIDLNVPSLRKLSETAGQPIAGTSGFGSLQIIGDVEATAKRVAFRNANVEFDGMTGQGDLTLDLAGNVPGLTGSLAVDKLDANAFMATGKKVGSEPQGDSSPQSRPAVMGPQAPSSEWSTLPIDFSPLSSFNADLNFRAEQILYQDLKIGKSVVSLKIENAILTAKLEEIALYDGKGFGSLRIDGRRPKARIASTIELANVQALPFLTDAAEFDRLEGTGNFSYNINTVGGNERQFVRNLNGAGKLEVLDGAWRGVNLASMARKVQSTLALLGQQSNDAGQENVGGGQKTDFAELNGTFSIQNGILKNEDFVLLNPFVRVSGRGNVRMPRKLVNYRLQPKLVATTQGQGGQVDASGVSVPILVEGTWDNLKYRADFKGMLSGALTPGTSEDGSEPLQNILQGAGQAFGGGNANAEDDKSEDNSDSKTPSPGNLLKNLLGGSAE